MSGRRGRIIRGAGIGIAGAICVYFVMFVVALLGGPRAPVVPAQAVSASARLSRPVLAWLRIRPQHGHAAAPKLASQIIVVAPQPVTQVSRHRSVAGHRAPKKKAKNKKPHPRPTRTPVTQKSPSPSPSPSPTRVTSPAVAVGG